MVTKRSQRRLAPPILGAHMSISGGFDEALRRGRAEGCDCVQVFTVAPRIWPVPLRDAKKAVTSSIRDIDAAAVEAFRVALDEFQIRSTLVHASYLLNLASPDDALWKRSIDGLVLEMNRAAQLSIPAVVLHPGSFTTSSEPAGLKRIALALREVSGQLQGHDVVCLLENTAGQGSQLGHRLEHLAELLDRLASPERFGVCLDTCHFFAAGYAFDSRESYRATFADVDRLIGVTSIKAFHLNDSKQPLGSRKDRHEHIGQGEMGLEPFRLLLNDTRFRQIPMYLETPKGNKGKQTWDSINLATLRGLIKLPDR